MPSKLRSGCGVHLRAGGHRQEAVGLEGSLHEILQVLSVTLFEQVPILQACGDVASQENRMGFYADEPLDL